MNFVKTICFSATFLAASFLNAQGVAVADLQQDIALIKREVGQLRLEVEQLRRENSELQQKLSSVKNSTVGSDAVRAQMMGVRSEVNSRNDALKREILASVKKELDAVVSQTNAAIAKIAKAVESRPQAELPASFSENYPKTGIPYVVKSGDTIGKLARLYNSRTQWILDANKISDPARIKIGDKIFIPQQ